MLVSYLFLLSGILFLFLGGVLAVSSREQNLPKPLLCVGIASVAWATAYSLLYDISRAPPLSLYIFDAFRLVAWMLPFVSLLGAADTAYRFRRMVSVALPVCLFIQVFLVLALWRGGIPAEMDVFPSWIKMLLATLGLYVALQAFVRTPVTGRRSLKFLSLSASILFAFDGYMAADAAITGAADASLIMAAALVHIVVFGFFSVGALRSSSWPTDLTLSHSVVKSTIVFAAISSYWFLVAVGSYYIESYGGTWSRSIQIAFMLSALAGLGALVLSETVRAWFRVFVTKHFQRYKYDYRSEWLAFARQLADGASDGNIAAVSIEAIAKIVDSPGGVMWVVDDARSQYKHYASWNSVARGSFGYADPVPAFCSRFSWLIDLVEFQSQSESYGNLVLPDWLSKDGTAWLIVPMILGDELVGMVMLEKPSVVPELNFEDRDLLKIVGRAVAAHVSQFEASRRLSEHQQFGAYHRFSTFLMHDLKNLIAQLSLVIKNADKHKHNPEFIDDAMNTLSFSVDRMNKMIRQFSGGTRIQSPSRVSLLQIIETVIARSAMRNPRPEVNDNGLNYYVHADSDRLASAIEHIVANAQEATPANGLITIDLEEIRQGVEIRISDTGSGMSEDFIREKLFKPFESTKSGAGLGVGAYQSREYIRTLGGDLSVYSVPGEGSIFSISLPVVSPPHAVEFKKVSTSS